jgi:hypothetical protein
MEIDYVSVEVMEIDQAVFTAREVPSWARPIMDFMVNGQLPPDEAEAHRIIGRSKAYTIINKEIYKRSTIGVLQRCVESFEGQEMLREIHQGECGHHASSRALVSKAFRHGFYWSTALQEGEDLVQKCNGCQRYRYVSNVSIICDAPCLFLHHLLSVSLHFVAFLCIFWN